MPKPADAFSNKRLPMTPVCKGFEDRLLIQTGQYDVIDRAGKVNPGFSSHDLLLVAMTLTSETQRQYTGCTV